MNYTFLDISDDELLAGASMPMEGGVCFAMLTTGFNTEIDEAVSLSVVAVGADADGEADADADGELLFDEVVKPHNLEEWQAGPASGGIGPADVEDKEPLYALEDELSEVIDDAKFIVSQHIEFAKAILDHSWIALPNCQTFDICELFRLSHASADYPEEPATVATVEEIASYYGLNVDLSTSANSAKAISTCYSALVREFKERRDAKGEEYWEERHRRLVAQQGTKEHAERVAAIRERRFTQMNALLWVAAGLIFVSLAIQMYQNGYDMGMIIVAGAAAVFMFTRAVINWRKK